jgi:Xaa-Pro aminopeptidase
MDLNAALDLIEDVSGDGLEMGAAQPAYPDFPLEEHQRRYARLQALLDHAGLDALLLTQEENVRYLSGYNSVVWAVRWLPGMLLATADPRQAVLFPSAFDEGAARGTSWVAEVDGHLDPSELPGKVAGHLRRLGIEGGRVGVETGQGSVVMLPWPVSRDLMGLVGDGAADASRIMSTLRMLKSPREVERVRRIVGATTAGYRAGLEAAKPGMTERELVSIVASTMYAQGATAGTRPLFLNCVAGPDRYPLVDTVASDRPFRSGDVVFLDGGGGGDGYMSDLIRLIAVGEVTERTERHARLAQQATAAMVEAIAPGLTVSELFRVGAAVYADAGLGASAGGISGHSIGMEVWERPLVRDHGDDAAEDVRLRPGMTLCIEPILLPTDDAGALEGIFVVEQQVLVTDDGCEVLSADLDPALWRAT